MLSSDHDIEDRANEVEIEYTHKTFECHENYVSVNELLSGERSESVSSFSLMSS